MFLGCAGSSEKQRCTSKALQLLLLVLLLVLLLLWGFGGSADSHQLLGNLLHFIYALSHSMVLHHFLLVCLGLLLVVLDNDTLQAFQVLMKTCESEGVGGKLTGGGYEVHL
jgi:uncharacterized membrane protein